jgi:hypothetical protein
MHGFPQPPIHGQAPQPKPPYPTPSQQQQQYRAPQQYAPPAPPAPPELLTQQQYQQKRSSNSNNNNVERLIHRKFRVHHCLPAHKTRMPSQFIIPKQVCIPTLALLRLQIQDS